MVFQPFDLPDPKALAEGEQALRAQVRRARQPCSPSLTEAIAFSIQDGNDLPWINQHRDRVHAANSQLTQ